ncbi:EAL domain-containing protein [Acetobacterium wieringae]|uniref:EAL domain-containing protein n=1 Tax=Acetobacterium wieringae TaxID=52694 RepID=A0A5D0WKM3_9FIRM|nr:EAL domain-containing protein [Acetobacterium wieringae]TYC84719.1 EAL domain-containing protein [Acetobacterium wieringae]
MTLQNSISMTLYLTFVIYVVLGTYTLTLNKDARLNRVFAALCFCYALWSLTGAATNSAATAAEALFWRRFSVLGWGVAYSIFLHVIILLRNAPWSQADKKGLLLAVLYIPALINLIAFLIYSMPEYGHIAMVKTDGGWISTTDAQWFNLMFLCYYLSFTYVSMLLLVRWYKKRKNSADRTKAMLLMVSFGGAFFLGTITDFVLASQPDRWIPSLAPVEVIFPVAAIFYLIHKYGMISAPDSHNDAQQEGMILTAFSRSRLYKYISFILIVGSVLNFYGRIANGDTRITGMFLNFLLVMMGAVVMAIPYFLTSITAQENALGLMVGFMMPVVMLLHFNAEFSNIIWPVPIFFMMLTVIFNNRNIFLGLGFLTLLLELIFWLLLPDYGILVDQRLYCYRLLFYMIGIGLTAIITQIYVLRLKENSRQDAFQKMIAKLSADFVTTNRDNFEEKVNRLLEQSGLFTGTDRVYLGRFSPPDNIVVYSHEWLGDGIKSLKGSIEHAQGEEQLSWSVSQILKNDIVYIPSVDRLPAEAEAEQLALKKQKVRSRILVPIQSNHRIIGLLGFDVLDGRKGLRGINRDWLQLLANILADAIAKVDAENDMNYLAYYDPLTGIPNRSLFFRRLEQAIDLARKTQKSLGVIFFDLDGFKEINDTLGHDWGDQLLSRIGKRLTDCLGHVDLVGRFGGDEFLIMVPQISKPSELERMAEQVMSIFHRPMLVAEQELYLSGSGGIAVYPQDGETVHTLIKNADLAMYAAKKSGKGRIAYCSGKMKAAVLEKMTLTTSLHQALAKGELLLHYQPQICASTLEINGFEALLRWQHPERGLISPEVFIPLAEQSGLISGIGEWVLKTACAQNKLWQDQGYKPVRMGVNLSVEQFRSSNLERIIKNCLAETGLKPQYLELEITEGVAMISSQYVIRQLQALKKLGLDLSIDDFGTAFSSMNRLKNLPVDRIKIDRQFVWGIGVKPRDEVLVTVMIDLARELGLAVTAEGVETAEQLAFLQTQGCDEIQGFYFSKPVSAAAIEAEIYARQFAGIN